MCLPDYDPPFKLSAKSYKLLTTIKILSFVYVLILILKIFYPEQNSIFGDFMAFFVLILLFKSKHHYIAGLEIYYIGFNMFYTSIFIGLRLQNFHFKLKDNFLEEGILSFTIITSFISFIFYIIVIIFSFKTYQELKAQLEYEDYGK